MNAPGHVSSNLLHLQVTGLYLGPSKILLCLPIGRSVYREHLLVIHGQRAAEAGTSGSIWGWGYSVRDDDAVSNGCEGRGRGMGIQTNNWIWPTKEHGDLGKNFQ